MRDSPKRVMLAGDGAFVVNLCTRFGYGIEIQSFLDPGQVEIHRAALGGLGPRALHGPFGDLCAGSYDPMIREVTRNRFELACRFARELGCPDIILHHGYVPGTSFPANWLRRYVEFWQDFLQDKEPSLVFHVENMLEWDAALLCDAIDGIGDQRVDVCLDVGHCHCNSRETPLEWIERLGSRIGWVHIHNNHGESDEHLELDGGTIPMLEVCHALLEEAPEAVWSLESVDRALPASIGWIKANGF